MSFHGADWLLRPERDRQEGTDRLLEALSLRSGDVVCDVGAGNGYHTLRMARRVRPGGRVVASDLQPEMLSLLEARAEKAGVSNVRLVQASETDPGLRPKTCDLILLVDVYHELSNTVEAALLGSLHRVSQEA